MNKILYKYIRDYIKELGHKVLNPEDNKLRLSFVFFPKEIERLNLKYNYATTVGNSTEYKGLVYCYIYFNIPRIARFLGISYKHTMILDQKVIDDFIQRIFYHEYRHYQQLKFIKEIFGKKSIPDDIKKILETDADNYSRLVVNEDKEIPIGFIRGVVIKRLKELKTSSKRV